DGGQLRQTQWHVPGCDLLLAQPLSLILDDHVDDGRGDHHDVQRGAHHDDEQRGAHHDDEQRGGDHDDVQCGGDHDDVQRGADHDDVEHDVHDYFEHDLVYVEHDVHDHVEHDHHHHEPRTVRADRHKPADLGDLPDDEPRTDRSGGREGLHHQFHDEPLRHLHRRRLLRRDGGHVRADALGRRGGCDAADADGHHDLHRDRRQSPHV